MKAQRNAGGQTRIPLRYLRAERAIPLKGGIPMKAGNETIGAIAVTGSCADGDENYAAGGVAKIPDQLKSGGA